MIKLIIPLLVLPISIFFLRKTLFWWSTSFRFILLSIIRLIISYNPIISIQNSSYWTLTDSIRIPLITLTLWICALIIFARANVLLSNNSTNQFTIHIIFLALILAITFRASNILIFYISFESSLIPTLLLIIGWGYQPERIQAGIYIILYTIAASLPLLIRIIIIYNANNSLFIFSQIYNIRFSSSIIKLWWFISIIAFIVKIPLYIVHLWLPKAHVEAPVAGSMILAGILLKLGSYGLLRISWIFIYANIKLSPIITSAALWGGALTRFICIRQTDLKSLIAYSRVGHIGLLTAGIISCTTWGWYGALVIIIAHGLCSSALFALANITYESTHTRRIYLTKGLLSLFPGLTLWWFIIAAGNIAAPPTLNLVGEIILLSRRLFLSFWSIIALSLIRFLAAAYSLYLYTSSQHGQIPSFINPLNLTTPRNYSIIIFHTVPLFLLVSKTDIIIIWVWPYSWKTTLNCSFKSVAPTKAYFFSILYVCLPSKKFSNAKRNSKIS